MTIGEVSLLMKLHRAVTWDWDTSPVNRRFHSHLMRKSVSWQGSSWFQHPLIISVVIFSCLLPSALIVNGKQTRLPAALRFQLQYCIQYIHSWLWIPHHLPTSPKTSNETQTVRCRDPTTNDRSNKHKKHTIPNRKRVLSYQTIIVNKRWETVVQGQ